MAASVLTQPSFGTPRRDRESDTDTLRDHRLGAHLRGVIGFGVEVLVGELWPSSFAEFPVATKPFSARSGRAFVKVRRSWHGGWRRNVVGRTPAEEVGPECGAAGWTFAGI